MADIYDSSYHEYEEPTVAPVARNQFNIETTDKQKNQQDAYFVCKGKYKTKLRGQTIMFDFNLNFIYFTWIIHTANRYSHKVISMMEYEVEFNDVPTR